MPIHTQAVMTANKRSILIQKNHFPQRSSENRFVASPHAYGFHQEFHFQTTFPI
ncbi:hypothetical protein [Neisseria sicca]|uniref:hypothetical protein n=1 Tax=Neisseria sicca TaxID=490 RepID=UPI003FA0684C